MQILGLEPEDCRAFMIRTEEWKYILHEKFRSQLYNMIEDPDEFYDLGEDPATQQIRRELHEALFSWLRKRKIRTTAQKQDAQKLASEIEAEEGIFIGFW